MTLDSAVGAFGYASLRSDKIDDWAEYGPKFLGLQLVERTRSALKFRMDDRKQRIVVSSEETAQNAFGWEVEDAAALDRLAGRLEAAKVPVERLPAAVVALRGVRAGIAFADPAGTRLEAFYGAEASDTPFVPGRPISGFRTGTLGMGHVVLHVKSVDDLRWFYQDVLGFGLSDYILRPFRAYFCHVNPRHHSLAFIETGKNGIHHMMVELFSLDDVGQAYDIALTDPESIGSTFGRHTNDYVTSFYSWSPSGFMVEYGWGGRLVDPGNWTPEEAAGPSLWGHERAWLSPEKRDEARAMRRKLAEDGIRQPVQVLDGNHRLMPGTCPWWDAATAERKAG
jgi:2,3-dihydroxybiphenyl 1,2-dioxygenase